MIRQVSLTSRVVLSSKLTIVVTFETSFFEVCLTFLKNSGEPKKNSGTLQNMKNMEYPKHNFIDNRLKFKYIKKFDKTQKLKNVVQ